MASDSRPQGLKLFLLLNRYPINISSYRIKAIERSNSMEGESFAKWSTQEATNDTRSPIYFAIYKSLRGPCFPRSFRHSTDVNLQLVHSNRHQHT